MQTYTNETGMLETLTSLWRRRKVPGLIAFFCVLAAGLAVMASLPNQYRSTTTVLVQQHQVPDTFVRGTVASNVEMRLQRISEAVLSRARLQNLAERFELYPELRDASPAAVARQMREDVELEIKRAGDIYGQETTIAFTLAYQGADPDTVAKVVNTLAADFVREYEGNLQQQASNTSVFLKEQLDRVREDLVMKEGQVNQFREEHIGELPEQQAANLATLARLNEEFRLNNETRVRLLERRDRLQAERLYTGMEDSAALVRSDARLARLNQQLAELESRFTDKHPDVVRTRSEIAALEETSAGAGEPQEGSWGLQSLQNELAAIEASQKRLREMIAQYQYRVEQAPVWDQELQSLSRDYAGTKALYASLSDRYAEAQIAQMMEQESGSQFRVVEPAIPAAEPFAPSRSRVLILALALGVIAAGAVMVLAEQKDSSFHGLDDLRSFTVVPVLAGIPHIATRAAGRGAAAQAIYTAGVMTLALVLIFAIFTFIASDNYTLVRILSR